MCLDNIVNNKCVCFAKQDWNSENKSIKHDKLNRFDSVIWFFDLQLENYCRKQISFNLGDWWIMLSHHIGLPPAIDRYPKLPVSGNILISTI